MKIFVKKKIILVNKINFVLLLILFINCNYIYSQSKQTIQKSLNNILKQEQYSYYNPIQSKNIEKYQNNLAAKISVVIEKFFYFIAKIFKKFTFIAMAFFILVSLALLYFIYSLIKRLALGLNKPKNSFNSQFFNDSLNLDYKSELQNAFALMQAGKYKEAISFSINALWLYYHSRKIIIFNQSLTNREYIRLLKQQSEYKILQSIIYEGEKSVYSGVQLNEKSFTTIWENINKIISDPGKD